MIDAESISATTAAGVELMKTFHSSADDTVDHSGAGDDLLLQCRILQSQALDDRRARQRAEDELKFMKHKVADRDKKLEVARAQLSASQTEVYSLRKQLDERSSAAAALKEQVAELTQQLDLKGAELRRSHDHLRESLSQSAKLAKSTVSPTSASGSGSDTFQPVPRRERRGSVTDAINERAKNLGMKRKMRLMSQQQQTSQEAMERDLMYEADLHSTLTQRNFARGITAINDLLKAEAEGADDTPVAAKSTLVSFDGIKRYGRGPNSHLTFNEPIDLRTPHDDYLKQKIQASGFSKEFSAFQDEMLKFAKNWKSANDGALSALWFIFQEKDKGSQCILKDPRGDFQKEVRTALSKTKTNLLDLIRTFYEGLKAVLGSERRVKLDWLKEQHPSTDIGVQVDIPPPEDPRIAAFSEEIAYLKKRQQQIHDEHNAKSNDLEMQREKAEVNTQFLQQKVFALHSAVHTALHNVYKHRFRWAPRCANHFAPLEKSASKKRQLEVGYNVLLGEAIDMEIKSLGQFSDYFVSDQLFGVDLASAFNATSMKEDKENGNGESLTLRRKEAVPMKKAKVDQARRLSTQLDTMLKQEKEESSTSNATTPLTPSMPISPSDISGVVSGSYSGSSSSSSAPNSRRTSPTDLSSTATPSTIPLVVPTKPVPGRASPAPREGAVLRRVDSNEGMRKNPPPSTTRRSSLPAVAQAQRPRSRSVSPRIPMATQNQNQHQPPLVRKNSSPKMHFDATAAPSSQAAKRAVSNHLNQYQAPGGGVSPTVSPFASNIIPTPINLELQLDPNAAPPHGHSGHRHSHSQQSQRGQLNSRPHRSSAAF